MFRQYERVRDRLKEINNFQYLLFMSWATRQTATFAQYHRKNLPKEKSQ